METLEEFERDTGITIRLEDVKFSSGTTNIVVKFPTGTWKVEEIMPRIRAQVAIINDSLIDASPKLYLRSQTSPSEIAPSD